MSETVHHGGYGKMKKCLDCGKMPEHHGVRMFLDGVCSRCGSESITEAIARPRWTVKRWSGSRVYLEPEELNPVVPIGIKQCDWKNGKCECVA